MQAVSRKSPRPVSLLVELTSTRDVCLCSSRAWNPPGVSIVCCRVRAWCGPLTEPCLNHGREIFRRDFWLLPSVAMSNFFAPESVLTKLCQPRTHILLFSRTSSACEKLFLDKSDREDCLRRGLALEDTSSVCVTKPERKRNLLSDRRKPGRAINSDCLHTVHNQWRQIRSDKLSRNSPKTDLRLLIGRHLPNNLKVAQKAVKHKVIWIIVLILFEIKTTLAFQTCSPFWLPGGVQKMYSTNSKSEMNIVLHPFPEAHTHTHHNFISMIKAAIKWFCTAHIYYNSYTLFPLTCLNAYNLLISIKMIFSQKLTKGFIITAKQKFRQKRAKEEENLPNLQNINK